MRLIAAWMLALFCEAVAAADTPVFYVVDMRHAGSATLHAITGDVAAGTELPYVLTDPKSRMVCCFRVGARPGAATSAVLFKDEGDAAFDYAGSLTGKAATGARAGDIGFGFTGMTAVRTRGRDTWEVAMGQGARPVIVRQCTGIEGIHTRLYRSITDRKPYADYYIPLGYETEPTCH
jgi:hypothetical protein